MTAYFLLPHSLKLVLQVLEWILLIGQICLGVVFWLTFRTRKHTFYAIALFCAGTALTALHSTMHISALRGLPLSPALYRLLCLPWALHFGAAGIVLALTLLLIPAAVRLQRTEITRATIREGMDNLPVGLCFSMPGGLPILVNRTMHTISAALTGQTVQNAETLWEVLRRHAAEGVLTLADDSHWKIDRTLNEVDGESVIQITAANITELHRLELEYRGQVKLLQAMNTRLRQYGREVVEMTTAREILFTKEYIHDVMGKVLLATHLRQNDRAHIASLLENWEQTIYFLGRSDQQIGHPPTDPAELYAAAAELGAELRIEGALPTDDPPVQELICVAARECLTNMVRHGGGTVLRVQVQQERGSFRICCTNNGAPARGALREGGGLTAIRTRVQQLGGSMQVIAAPAFRIEISVPQERSERT